ncbi:MAG: DUF262 domain-containing protein [Candidatus Pacearchaeota archaeon]
MNEKKDIVIESKDLPKMLEQLEEGFYAIPIFQRDFVWDQNNIKSLWDSIYRYYPIGSFLIWETEEKLPKHRDLLGIELKQNERGNYNYILDGQQRITSLLGSIKGVKRGKKIIRLFFNIRKGAQEDLESTSNELEDSPFIFEDELNELSAEEKSFVVPISDLLNFNTEIYRNLLKVDESLAEFYREVSDKLRTRYKLSIIKLNKIPIEEVCEIFTRVNQKGKKLTLVELMTAKTFKAKTSTTEEFYLRKILDDFNDHIEESYRGYKENIDETLFLRFLSIIEFRTCREKDLLSLSAEKIQSFWKNSSTAYGKAILYLKEDLKVSSPVIMPYPPMLVALSYFFHKLGKTVLDDKLRETINRWFWVNSFSAAYQGATNEKIRQDCEWFDKVLLGDTKLNIKLKKIIEPEDIIGQELVLGNAFCKSLLCMLNNLNPIDFRDHSKIHINQILVKTKKDELHHIFPIKSEIGKRNKDSLINSIVNVCFLPKDTNSSISNKNPKDYLKEFRSKNEHFDEDIKTHLLSIEEALNNDFEGFIRKRAELMKDEVYSLMGITSDIAQQLKKSPDELWNKYELELRGRIDDLLKEKYGESYWSIGTIPQDIHDKINEKVKKEIKIRPDLKEQILSSRGKLENCDVMDYLKIIQKNWDLFESLFGSKEETENQFKNLQVFRNQLKHVKNYQNSTEMDELTRKKGELALLWLQKLLRIDLENQSSLIDFTSIDDLYKYLIEGILRIDPKIEQHNKKHYTAFRKLSNFASLKLQNQQIKVAIRIPSDKLKDSRNFARDVTNVGHLGTGNYEIKLTSKDDLVYVLDLIKQAYENNYVKGSDQEYDLKYHFSKLEDAQMLLKLKELMKKIKNISKNVKEICSKNHITYDNHHAFTALYIQKEQFWTDIKLSKNKITDSKLDLRPHKDKIWSHIRIDHETDLDRLMPFIKQAYDNN